MRLIPVLALAFATALAGIAAAAERPAPFEQTGATDLAAFKWNARPVVVFADSPNDPRYIEQMEMLHAREGDLAERDVVVLTDTDPDSESALRTQLRPRGFMLVLIGKDGGIRLRKPRPWSVRELSRSIDKIPTRQQEVRERREKRAREDAETAPPVSQ